MSNGSGVRFSGSKFAHDPPTAPGITSLAIIFDHFAATAPSKPYVDGHSQPFHPIQVAASHPVNHVAPRQPQPVRVRPLSTTAVYHDLAYRRAGGHALRRVRAGQRRAPLTPITCGGYHWQHSSRGRLIFQPHSGRRQPSSAPLAFSMSSPD